MKNKLSNKFSLLETGLLLLLLSIILLIFSLKTITIYLSPAININSITFDNNYNNTIGELTITDNWGTSYYDSSYSLTFDQIEGSKVYSTGYLVTIRQGNTISENIVIPVEISDRHYTTLLDSIAAGNSDSITVRGILHEQDINRYTCSTHKAIISLGCKNDNIGNVLIPYYLELNDPTDEIIEFIISIISFISATTLVFLWFMSRNKRTEA